MKNYLKKWISEPLILPRWMLTAKYVFFVILGILAAISGVPSFDLTTWAGYTTPWSLGVTLSASIAAFASLHESRERQLEKWSSLTLVALFCAYLVAAWLLTLAEFELGRVIFCWLVTGVTMLPAVRAFDLLRRYGLRRVD